MLLSSKRAGPSPSLAALLRCEFAVRDWREVWALRAVSHECHAAVHSDDLWRAMYARFSADKAPPPPRIRSLLELEFSKH